MGDITEISIKVDEIKKEPVESVETANTWVQPENSIYGSLKEEQFHLEEDEIKPPLGIFLLPEQEIEAVVEEKDEIKPPLGIFLLPEQEIEAVVEEKDPLAQSNTEGNDAPEEEEELISIDGRDYRAAKGKCLACGCCGMRFSTRQHMTTHTYIPTGETPFACVPMLHACAVCVKRFRERPQPGVDSHSEERPFACPTCPKRFAQRAHLAMHVCARMQEKPFACYACDERFTTKGSLAAHWRTHSVEKPFACKACGLRFALKQALDGHLRTLLHFKNSARCPVCTLCGKSFPHPRSLACHMRYTHWKQTADTPRTT